MYWSNEKGLFFVTAKHVILKDTGGALTSPLSLTSYTPGSTGFQRCVLEIDLPRALKDGEVHAHKTHDVAIVRVAFTEQKDGRNDVYFLHHVSAKELPDSGIMVATAVTLFESAVVSNDAFVLGYPAAIGVFEIPQIDYTQPLLRKGILAGKNFVKRTLIVDCPTYPGNSGGPVFEVDENQLSRSMRLVGVVSEWIPFKEIWQNHPFGYQNQQLSNSGYTVVEPTDFILELVR